MRTTWKVVTRPGGTCETLVWWGMIVAIACALSALLGIVVMYYEEGTLANASKDGLLFIMFLGAASMLQLAVYGSMGLYIVAVPLFLVWLLVTGLVKDYQHVTKPYKTE